MRERKRREKREKKKSGDYRNAFPVNSRRKQGYLESAINVEDPRRRGFSSNESLTKFHVITMEQGTLKIRGREYRRKLDFQGKATSLRKEQTFLSSFFFFFRSRARQIFIPTKALICKKKKRKKERKKKRRRDKSIGISWHGRGLLPPPPL